MAGRYDDLPEDVRKSIEAEYPGREQREPGRLPDGSPDSNDPRNWMTEEQMDYYGINDQTPREVWEKYLKDLPPTKYPVPRQQNDVKGPRMMLGGPTEPKEKPYDGQPMNDWVDEVEQKRGRKIEVEDYYRERQGKPPIPSMEIPDEPKNKVIQNFKEKYPAYAEMKNLELGEHIYGRYYADRMTRREFQEATGLQGFMQGFMSQPATAGAAMVGAKVLKAGSDIWEAARQILTGELNPQDPGIGEAATTFMGANTAGAVAAGATGATKGALGSAGGKPPFRVIEGGLTKQQKAMDDITDIAVQSLRGEGSTNSELARSSMKTLKEETGKWTKETDEMLPTKNPSKETLDFLGMTKNEWKQNIIDSLDKELAPDLKVIRGGKDPIRENPIPHLDNPGLNQLMKEAQDGFARAKQKGAPPEEIELRAKYFYTMRRAMETEELVRKNDAFLKQYGRNSQTDETLRLSRDFLFEEAAKIKKQIDNPK